MLLHLSLIHILLNCDINSPPQETGGKSKVDGQFSSEDDHQQPMDMCFIDVGQVLTLVCSEYIL